jgi:Helix-turn-helix domain
MDLLDSKTLEKQMDQLYTTDDLIRMYGVTYMTIHTWRKTRGLPQVTIKGDRRDCVRYHPQDIQKWAAQQGLRAIAQPRLRLIA